MEKLLQLFEEIFLWINYEKIVNRYKDTKSCHNINQNRLYNEGLQKVVSISPKKKQTKILSCKF